MKRELFGEQTDIFNPSDARMQAPILLIGAGRIGSWTALFLAKLGLKDITVFDPDIVENQNRANQLYGESSIGKRKVVSLQEDIYRFSSIYIKWTSAVFPGLIRDFLMDRREQGYIVLVTVDSMKSRQAIFEWLRENWMNVHLFIDARTGGDRGTVFAFEPMQPSLMGQYAKTLHVNEDLRRLSGVGCTGRSIVDVSVTVSARITNTVRKYLTHKEYPFETDIDLRNDIWIVNKDQKTGRIP